MKKGWPSYVEMRMHWVHPFNGGEVCTWTQRFLWFGFEEGSAKRLEYREGAHVIIYCVEPGWIGVPLSVRWVRTREHFPHAPERNACWPGEPSRLTVTQIWTREARRAGVALYLGMRRLLRLDHSICRRAAWWAAQSYERSEWEAVRE